MDPYLKTLDLSSQEYFLRDLWQVILKASSQVSGPGSSTIQVSSDFFFFFFSASFLSLRLPTSSFWTNELLECL